MTMLPLPGTGARADMLPLNPQMSMPQVSPEKAKMKESAQQFEAYFVYQFLELMTPKPEDGGMFSSSSSMSGSFGEQMFRHELNQHMAQAVVRQGGFGVTDAVYRAMLHQQEARP